MSMTAVDMMTGFEEMEPEQQMAPSMTNEEVLSAVTNEITWANERYYNSLRTNGELAWAYFLGEAPVCLDKDVDEYFELIKSRDVADTIESTLAEILPAFATDRPAEFDPLGPGDADQAAMESDVCNDVLMESGLGFLELTTAAKNALLLRLGVLEISWDTQTDVSYEELMGVDEASVYELSLQQDVEIQEMAGPPPGSGFYNLQVKRFEQRGEVKVEAVPIDEMLVSSDAVSLDYDQARFVGRMTLVSRSDLIAQGYDRGIVQELPAFSGWSGHPGQRGRQGRESVESSYKYRSADESTDMIETVRCYYRIDEDKDGIAELRRILVAGTYGSWELLEDEPADYQPYASGAGYIWQHQPFGISLFDKLKQIQDLKTKFWRISLEAAQRAARDRVGLMPGTDVDDFMASQFGGAIRITNPQGIVPIPAQRYPTEISDIYAIADKARREGGGGAVDKSGQENMPVEAGAHGVERMMTAIEELNSMVARMLAETLVRQSYLKIHHCLRLYGNPIEREVGGQWQQVDPQQWRPRRRISVATGLTLSERQRLAQALGMIIANQKELMAQGSTLTNPQTLYRAVMDQARLLGIQNPDLYMVDPSSQEGQQAAQAQAEQQQQAQQQQAQMAAQQLESQGRMLAGIEQVKNQGRVQTEQIKQQGDAMQAQSDMQETMLKIQADNAETAAKLRADNEQAMAELEQKYAALRLELVSLEMQHKQKAPNVEGL